MQYALVGGERREAEPGLAGVCPVCDSPVLPRCGEVRVRHWAHRGRRDCDTWREPETVWHRRWKNRFPKDWQEVIGYDDTGERHIADVKTENDLVIEFQHSHLDPKERAARETFYGDMVWVVDGTRLKRDWPRFEKAFNDLIPLGKPIFTSSFPEKHFPRNWIDANAPVLFDFLGLEKQPNLVRAKISPLWMLLPERVDGNAVVVEISRKHFVQMALRGASFVGLGKVVADELAAQLQRRRIAAEFHRRRTRSRRIAAEFHRQRTRTSHVPISSYRRKSRSGGPRM